MVRAMVKAKKTGAGTKPRIDFFLHQNNPFAGIDEALKHYRAHCNPAELAAAESLMPILKSAHAQAVKADIGMTVGEDGELWCSPTKEGQHEASVNLALYSAFLLGGLIIDSVTSARILAEIARAFDAHKQEQVSRARNAGLKRKNYSKIVTEIIERHARTWREKTRK
jgi:hypothetical protein